MPIKNIPRNSVSKAVFEQIKQAIASGEWKQGSKIPSENELALQMGVSRMSVHNAMQKLSSLGIVESRQGEGTYVCTLNGGQYINALIPMVVLEQQDVFYMLEFRHMLECEGAELAAERAKEENIKALKENHQQMSLLDPFSSECPELDMQFHYEVARATENPMLIQVFTILRGVFIKSIHDILKVMPDSNALHYHRLLIEAIEKHDGVTARSVMSEHLRTTMQYFKGNRGEK